MSVSANGQVIAFVSSGGDLVPNDNNNTFDVFVYYRVSGATVLVSVNAAGTGSGNGASGINSSQVLIPNVDISGDGRYVTFTSAASDLTANDTDGLLDVFVRDLVEQKTYLVSVNHAGTASGNNASVFPSISLDGSVVVFRSAADDLAANDNNRASDVFARNIRTGTTLLVSVNAAGTGSGNGASIGGIVSADGRFVAFGSNSSDLVSNDTNGATEDVFLRDLQTGTTTLVSANLEGTGSGNGASSSAVISEDGRRVVFMSRATNLVALPDNNQSLDVFVRDISTGITSLVSVNRQGNATGARSSYFHSPNTLSADGRVIAFVSEAPDLVSNDTNDASDVFVRDVVAGTTVLVSVKATGDGSGNGPSGGVGLTISADGRFVAFESQATDLVAGSTAFLNVFVRDLRSSTTLLASAGGNNHSFTPALSRDASILAFNSMATNLSPRDTDAESDVYAFSVPGGGSLEFESERFGVSESVGAAFITVRRSGDLSVSATVDYRTSNGTADARSDYTHAVGTLTFAPGESNKIFQVFITDDVHDEDDETIILTLSNPTGQQLGLRTIATLIITDNDTGVSAMNPIDETGFFVRQHYRDFLNREPDEGGFVFWSNIIESCGSDQQCRQVRRVNVSAAFFLSIEFQETGYLVYRMYKAAYGDINPPSVPVPVRLEEFLRDTQRVGRGVVVGVGNWQAQLEANKVAYSRELVTATRFRTAYPQGMTATDFVEKLNQNAGGVLSEGEKAQLIGILGTEPGDTDKRAQVLRAVAEDETLRTAEFNKAFVLMQYFGYLRRNPDDPQDTNFDGWRFWLGQLERFNGDFNRAEMVRAFIESIEYRKRFGQ